MTPANTEISLGPSLYSPFSSPSFPLPLHLLSLPPVLPPYFPSLPPFFPLPLPSFLPSSFLSSPSFTLSLLTSLPPFPSILNVSIRQQQGFLFNCFTSAFLLTSEPLTTPSDYALETKKNNDFRKWSHIFAKTNTTGTTNYRAALRFHTVPRRIIIWTHRSGFGRRESGRGEKSSGVRAKALIFPWTQDACGKSGGFTGRPKTKGDEQSWFLRENPP